MEAQAAERTRLGVRPEGAATQATAQATAQPTTQVTPQAAPRPAASALSKSLLDTFQQEGLLGSFTTAAQGAWDKDLRRDDQGRWNPPIMTRVSEDPSLLEGIGQAVAGLAQKVGGRLDQAGFAADADATRGVFDKFQQTYGLTDEQMQTAWRDSVEQYRPWKKDEGPLRILSDGTLLPNPQDSTWLDPDRAYAAVAKANVPEEAKAALMAKLPRVADAIATSKLTGYEAAASMVNSATFAGSLGSFGLTRAAVGKMVGPEEWANANGRKEDFGSAAFVRDYEAAVVDPTPAVRSFMRGMAGRFALGANDLATQVLGVAGVAGIDAAGEAAAGASEASAMIASGLPETGLAGDVAQQVVPLGAQMLPAAAVGRITSLLGAGASTAAKAGTTSAAVAAGFQSAGSNYAQLVSEGDPDAREKAVKTGVSTAIITSVFMGRAGGVERAAGSLAAGGAGRATLRETLAAARAAGIKNIAKVPELRALARDTIESAVGEATEEGIDQYLSAFLMADPDTNLADAWDRAVRAAKVGLVAGPAATLVAGEAGAAIKEARGLAMEALSGSPESARAVVAVADAAGRQTVAEAETDIEGQIARAADQATLDVTPPTETPKRLDANKFSDALAPTDQKGRRLPRPMDGPVGNYVNDEGVEVTIKDDSEIAEFNGEQYAGDIEVDFMGLSDPAARKQGASTREMGRIVAEADKRDMSISVTVDPARAAANVGQRMASGDMSPAQIKTWLEKFGFIFDGRVGYRPRSSEDRAAILPKSRALQEGDLATAEAQINEDPDARTFSDPDSMFEVFMQRPKDIPQGFLVAGDGKVYWYDGASRPVPLENVSEDYDYQTGKFKLAAAETVTPGTAAKAPIISGPAVPVDAEAPITAEGADASTGRQPVAAAEADIEAQISQAAAEVRAETAATPNSQPTGQPEPSTVGLLPKLVALNGVDPGVVGFINEGQILDAVVRLIPVEVMNDFVGEKVSPEMVRENPSMLSDLLPADVDLVVASRIRAETRIAVAALRAKLLASLSAGRDAELAPALFTSDLNPGEVSRLLPQNGFAPVDIKGVPEFRSAASRTELSRLGTIGEDGKFFPAGEADLLNRHAAIVASSNRKTSGVYRTADASSQPSPPTTPTTTNEDEKQRQGRQGQGRLQVAPEPAAPAPAGAGVAATPDRYAEARKAWAFQELQNRAVRSGRTGQDWEPGQVIQVGEIDTPEKVAAKLAELEAEFDAKTDDEKDFIDSLRPPVSPPGEMAESGEQVASGATVAAEPTITAEQWGKETNYPEDLGKFEKSYLEEEVLPLTNEALLDRFTELPADFATRDFYEREIRRRTKRGEFDVFEINSQKIDRSVAKILGEVGDAKAAELQSNTEPDIRVIITPDQNPDYPYRATRTKKGAPIGHTNYRTFEEAIANFAGDNTGGPPYGVIGEYRVSKVSDEKRTAFDERFARFRLPQAPASAETTPWTPSTESPSLSSGSLPSTDSPPALGTSSVEPATPTPPPPVTPDAAPPVTPDAAPPAPEGEPGTKAATALQPGDLIRKGRNVHRVSKVTVNPDGSVEVKAAGLFGADTTFAAGEMVDVGEAGGTAGAVGARGGATLPTLLATATSGPIKGLDQIIRDLAKGLKIPIRYGRLTTPRFAGYFKRVQDLIGSAKAIDLPTVSHEVGHKLDALTGMSADTRIAAELNVLGDPATPDSRSSWTKSRSRAYKMGEGVAEFVRYWLTDPARAVRSAPVTHSVFEDILDANKDFGDVMRQAQEDIRIWRSAPDEARIDAHIITSNPNGTKYTGAQLIRDMVDDLHILHNAEKNIERRGVALKPSESAYMGARLLRGSYGMANVFITGGAVDFKTKAVTPGTGLQHALEGVRGRLNEFRRWIVAMQARELHAQGKETGMQDVDVQATAARYENDPVFQDAFTKVKAWNDAVLQYSVDAGLVSQEGADAMRKMNQDYVPFHRLFEIGAGEVSAMDGGGGTGRGLNVGKPGSLRGRAGSPRPIIDPLETMLRNAYTIITAAEKAAVRENLIAMADKPGSGAWVERIAAPKDAVKVPVERIREQLEAAGADMSAVPDDVVAEFFQQSRQAPWGENIIKGTKPDGTAQFVRVNKDVFDTFNALDLEDSGTIIKALAIPANILRSGVVLDVAFSLANVIRDNVSSAVINRYGMLPFEAAARGMAAMIGNPKLVMEWKAAGGENAIEAWFFDQKKRQEFLRRKIVKELTPAERALIVAKSPLYALRWLTGLAETVTRVGEYDKAFRARVKEGMSEGDARRLAAFEARDRQDFAKGGAKTKILRHLVAFWNAQLQGQVSFYRAIKDRPVRTLMQGMAWITIPKLIEQALNWDDEDYWDRPKWERRGFFLIPIGKGDDGKTKFLRVPVPFEQGVIFATIPGEILSWFKQNEPDKVKDFPQYMLKQSIPNPVPQALLTLGEVSFGKQGYSFFRDKPIVPTALADAPPEYQWTEQTSLTARKIGNALGMSPAKVDYAIAATTGGIGRQATHNVIDNIISFFTDEEGTATRQWPGARFLTTPGSVSSQSVEDFYERLNFLRGERTAAKLDGRKFSSNELRKFEKVSEEFSEMRKKARTTKDPAKRTDAYNRIVDLARKTMADGGESD
ncbi:MAG: LPD38 domain-containing protein [Phycisphaerales bacterium]